MSVTHTEGPSYQPEPPWDDVAARSAESITSQNTRGTASWIEKPSGPIFPASRDVDDRSLSRSRSWSNDSGEEENANVGVAEAPRRSSKSASKLEEKKAGGSRPRDEIERWLTACDEGEHFPPAVEKLPRLDWMSDTVLAVVAEFELHSAARIALCMDDAAMPFDGDLVGPRLGMWPPTARRATKLLVQRGVITKVGELPPRKGRNSGAYLYKPCARSSSARPASNSLRQSQASKRLTSF